VKALTRIYTDGIDSTNTMECLVGTGKRIYISRDTVHTFIITNVLRRAHIRSSFRARCLHSCVLYLSNYSLDKTATVSQQLYELRDDLEWPRTCFPRQQI
jgi:hypothetical protein